MKKNIFYITITGLMFLFFLYPTTIIASGTLKIGEVCTSNDQCASGDCEESTKKDAGGNEISYCDCDETDSPWFVPNAVFDDTSEDCAAAYPEVSTDPNNWACENGGDTSYNVDVCKYEPTGKIFSPAGTTQPDFLDFATDPNNAIQANELEAMLRQPQLRIKLPGLEKFSKPDIQSLTTEDDEGNRYVSIPYAGEYIAAVYRFAIAAVGIISVLMIIVAGLQWMTSAGNSDRVSKAKSRIEHSLIGVLLAVGSYLFLFTINPNLVEFKNLKVLSVKSKNIDELESVSPEFYNFAPSGITGATIADLIGANQLPPCSKEAAQDAAQKIHDLPVCVGPCHCAYAASKFLQYIGCTNVYHGMADTLPKKLEESGWKTINITEANKNNLPIGLLWKKGHVGVSIGDGMDFESGTGPKDFGRFEKAGCPSSFVDAMKNPQACAFCGKIPKEAPWSGNFGYKKLGGTNTSDTCLSNQGWSKGKISDRGTGGSAWKTLTTPFLK